MVQKTKKHRRAKAVQKARESRREAYTRKPFVEHFYELRKRLFYIAVSITLFAAAAYAIERKLVEILLEPSHGQQFIYTSPIGGVDFLFKLCIYFGVIFSIPVIIYQLLKYVEPLIGKDSSKFIAYGTIISGILAIAGMLFGYFVGLPNALYFLLHHFVAEQVKPLITIQSYMSFVSLYMFGSALLFQMPLIMIFINRIKPLTPKKLLAGERWMILGAFVGAALMNPSPRVTDQLLLAGPVVIMYQVGILIIWLINRKGIRPGFVQELLVKDAQLLEARLEQSKLLKPIAVFEHEGEAPHHAARKPRERAYVNDVVSPYAAAD